MELFRKCPASDGKWIPVGRDRDDFKSCVACKHKCCFIKKRYPLAYSAKPLKGDGTK